MENTKSPDPETSPKLPPLPPASRLVMAGFWILLGGAAGINLAQSLWHLLDLSVGTVSIAVPVGGGLGALLGLFLGMIENPRVLVLLTAVFAGSAAGAVTGKVCWGSIGEIGGQIAGGLVAAIAWTIWFHFGRRQDNIP
jgi:hypothetical protein